MSQKIINYYRLCTVSLGGKIHPMDGLQKDLLGTLFNRKELEAFMREQNGHLAAREIVIGARDTVVPRPSESSKRGPVIVIY
jgi:hypothetical protein